MMRDEYDDDDEEEFDTRPPAPHEQEFNSKIEEAVGYAITDVIMKEQIHEEVFHPKPKAEFGFDPTVEGADPTKKGQMVAAPAAYAANQGTFETDEPEENKPTNLVASSKGYVMPKKMEDAAPDQVEKDIDKKFGGGPGGDSDDEEEGLGYQPNQALEAVEEGSDGEEEIQKQKKKKKMQKKGGSQNRITVAVRLRPLNKDEKVAKKKKKDAGNEAFMGWNVDNDDGGMDVMIQKGVRSKVEGKSMFHVDRVYEEQDHTEALYSDICEPIVTSVLDGLHGTIFGYGQTGGGKSYTIQGGKKGNGIIHLAAKDLFKRIAEDTEREYAVKATYFEIYNEQVRDLMGRDEEDNPKSRRATAVITTVNKLNVDLPVLNVREDPRRGDVFVDAQVTPVSSVENIVRVLHKGNRNRATEKTESNEFSSRSHAIFRLTVESHDRLEGEAEDVEGVKLRVAALSFVDLAGSENAMKAATSGVRKREGGKINQSLLSLSQVIHQLSMPKKKQPKHINYRDSKLTRLLQPQLSGNAAISIICCCSPAKKCVEETKATLKFAYNAKRIKLKPQINEIVDDKVLLENLKKELQEMRMKFKELQDYQERNPPAPPRPAGPEFPMIERFMQQMNMSVATADFMDAIEELSGPTLHEDEGPEIAAMPSIDSSRGGILSQSTVEESEVPSVPAASSATVEEEDEDSIEAFRRQILAKFMAESDDDDYVDEDEETHTHTENADTTMNDTTVNDTTMNDTTMNDTSASATTDYDTSVNRDYDTSMNRTFETVETRATTGDIEDKENQPQPESPPAISRKEPPEIEKAAPGDFREARPEESPLPLASPATGVVQNETTIGQGKGKGFEEDSSSDDTPLAPPDENDLNLIERFRGEILEKFRDEIVDEEAAHELDENAQNVAVIANELINKFKREIVYKYKDEFPEILVKPAKVGLTATRVGDNGIVGRVIEQEGVSSSVGRLNTDEDSSGSGSVEQFEDEFDEGGNLGNGSDDEDAATADQPHRHTPNRNYSTKTDRVVINGKSLLGGSSPAADAGPTGMPINSSLGQGASGSVSSDLSSEVADNEKEGSGVSPVPANPPNDDDYMIPPGEIAVKGGDLPGSVNSKMRIKFLEEKLLATDELVETLFVELENAKTFIRELVFENGKADQSHSALFGPAGTSGVTVVDEQILNQCEILKFAIYTSLLFFVFGQHELFLATVFFLWLSLEVATKT